MSPTKKLNKHHAEFKPFYYSIKMSVVVVASFSLYLFSLISSCLETEPLAHVHRQVNVSSLGKPSPRPLGLLPPLVPHPRRPEEGQRSSGKRGLGVCIPLDEWGWEDGAESVAADVGPGGGVGVLLAHPQTQPQACSPLMTLLHVSPHYYCMRRNCCIMFMLLWSHSCNNTMIFPLSSKISNHNEV